MYDKYLFWAIVQASVVDGWNACDMLTFSLCHVWATFPCLSLSNVKDSLCPSVAPLSPLAKHLKTVSDHLHNGRWMVLLMAIGVAIAALMRCQWLRCPLLAVPVVHNGPVKTLTTLPFEDNIAMETRSSDQSKKVKQTFCRAIVPFSNYTLYMP